MPSVFSFLIFSLAQDERLPQHPVCFLRDFKSDASIAMLVRSLRRRKSHYRQPFVHEPFTHP
jgi:hypothetical protein